jgi:hypothetical protein
MENGVAYAVAHCDTPKIVQIDHKTKARRFIYLYRSLNRANQHRTVRW